MIEVGKQGIPTSVFFVYYMAISVLNTNNIHYQIIFKKYC